MPLSSARQRLAARLMLVVLLVMAAAPGVARAMASARGDAVPGPLLCSASRGTGDGGFPAGETLNPLLHCAFCGLQPDSAAPPPAPPGLHPIAGPGQAAPVSCPAAAPTPASRSPAQPRAPPSTV